MKFNEGTRRARVSLSSFKDMPPTLSKERWMAVLTAFECEPFHLERGVKIGRLHSVQFEGDEAYAELELPARVKAESCTVVMGIRREHVALKPRAMNVSDLLIAVGAIVSELSSEAFERLKPGLQGVIDALVEEQNEGSKSLPKGWVRSRSSLSRLKDVPAGITRAQWETALSAVDEVPWHFDRGRDVGRVHSVQFEGDEAYATFDFPPDCVVGAMAAIIGFGEGEKPKVFGVVVHEGDSESLWKRISKAIEEVVCMGERG